MNLKHINLKKKMKNNVNTNLISTISPVLRSGVVLTSSEAAIALLCNICTSNTMHFRVHCSLLSPFLFFFFVFFWGGGWHGTYFLGLVEDKERENLTR